MQEILDLSQPKPSPDLIRKFVSQIIPDGKSNFRWYLNLDGENSTVQDMMVEGRKNHESVSFGGMDDAPPDGGAVINILDQNTYLSLTQHRLLSRANPSDTKAADRKVSGFFLFSVSIFGGFFWRFCGLTVGNGQ